MPEGSTETRLVHVSSPEAREMQVALQESPAGAVLIKKGDPPVFSWGHPAGVNAKYAEEGKETHE